MRAHAFEGVDQGKEVGEEVSAYIRGGDALQVVGSADSEDVG